MSGHGNSGRNGQDTKEKAPPRRMGRGGHGGMGSIEKAKDVRGTLRRLLNYLGEYSLLLIVVVALTVGGTLLNLAGPYLQGVAIDQFILTGDRAGLVRIITILAGTYLVGSLASMGAGTRRRPHEQADQRCGHNRWGAGTKRHPAHHQ